MSKAEDRFRAILVALLSVLAYLMLDYATTSNGLAGEVRLHCHAGVTITPQVNFWNRRIGELLPPAKRFRFVEVESCGKADVCFVIMTDPELLRKKFVGYATAENSTVFLNPKYFGQANTTSAPPPEGETGGIPERAFLHELFHCWGVYHSNIGGSILHEKTYEQLTIEPEEIELLANLSDIGPARRIWAKILGLHSAHQETIQNSP